MRISDDDLGFNVLAMRFAVALLALAPVGGVLALWPLPRSLETGTTMLKLAPSFDIHVNVQHAPSDLSDAVSRTKTHLKTDKLGRLVVGRGSSDSSAIQHAESLPSLQVSLTRVQLFGVSPKKRELQSSHVVKGTPSPFRRTALRRL